MYKQTELGKLSTDSIMEIYNAMNFTEKREIKKLAKILCSKCEKLSFNGAIELLGMIGMDMVARKEEAKGE